MTTTQETEQINVNELIKKNSRSFKVKLGDEDKQYGRYNGESPYQAANKALSEIIRNRVKAKEDPEVELSFFLIESTKGSKKKAHQYTGRRVKLDAPVSYTVKNGDKTQTITKEYKNILRKVKKIVTTSSTTETISSS